VASVRRYFMVLAGDVRPTRQPLPTLERLRLGSAAARVRASEEEILSLRPPSSGRSRPGARAARIKRWRRRHAPLTSDADLPRHARSRVLTSCSDVGGVAAFALIDAITDRRMTYAGLEATSRAPPPGLAERGYAAATSRVIRLTRSNNRRLPWRGPAGRGGHDGEPALSPADEIASSRDCSAKCLFTIPAFHGEARAAARRP